MPSSSGGKPESKVKARSLSLVATFCDAEDCALASSSCDGPLDNLRCRSRLVVAKVRDRFVRIRCPGSALLDVLGEFQ